MSFSKISPRLFFLIICALSTISCGGGGSGGGGAGGGSPAETNPDIDSNIVQAPAVSSFDLSGLSSLDNLLDIIHIRDLDPRFSLIHHRVKADTNTGTQDILAIYDRIQQSITESIVMDGWVQHLHEDNGLIFVYADEADGSILRTLKVNTTGSTTISPIARYNISQNSSIERSGGVLLLGDSIRNSIYIHQYGRVYSAQYSDAGSILQVTQIYEINNYEFNTEGFQLDSANGKLYIAGPDIHNITQLDLGSTGEITDVKEFAIPGQSGLKGAGIIGGLHNGEVFYATYLDKIFSYKKLPDDTLVEIANTDITYSFKDWVYGFAALPSGEILIQWQEGRGIGDGTSDRNIFGEYRYFEIDENGLISTFNEQHCSPSDSFSSYRHVNFSDLSNTFYGTGPTLVSYEVTGPEIECSIAVDINRDINFVNVTDFHAEPGSDIAYLLDKNKPSINVIRKTPGKIETIQKYPVNADITVATVESVQLAPDGNHLYIFGGNRTLIIAVNPDGTLANTTLSNFGSTGYADFSSDGNTLYMLQMRVNYFPSYYELFPVLSVYDRDSFSGELSLVQSIDLISSITNDFRLNPDGPIAISPDEKHLYIVSRVIGVLYVFDISDPKGPVFERQYFDPYTTQGVPQESLLDGITDTNGIAFSENGESVFLSIIGYGGSNTSLTGESTNLTLLSLRRNTTSGALDLLQEIVMPDNPSDITIKGSGGYFSPFITNNKLFVARSHYRVSDRPAVGVDVYSIANDGTLAFYERLTDSYLGKGISGIRHWSSDPSVIATNNDPGGLSSIPLSGK